MGGGVGRWPMEGGQGGRWGGGHQRAVWEQQKCMVLPYLPTGLIWLVTKVGGLGEVWGGGPWRAGKGGDGVGAPESSVQQKVHCFFLLGCSLKNLTTGLIFFAGDEGGGMGGGVGRWPMEGGQGGRWGGGIREQCGSNKSFIGFFFFFF